MNLADAYPQAQRLACGNPTTPLRRDAQMVAMAYLRLFKQLRVKPPITERKCNRCGFTHAIDHFTVFRKVRKDGSPHEYHGTRCKTCCAEVERKRIKAATVKAKAAAPKPVRYESARDGERPADIAERILDDAGANSVVVMRLAGRVVWLREGQPEPVGAELLGLFTRTADFRDVLGAVK